MKITRIDVGEIKDIQGWDELLRRSETVTPFLTTGYIENFWAQFGDKNQPFILCAEKDSRLMGIAPLMLTGSKLGFIGAPHSDYTDFIISDNKKEVITAFFTYLKEDASWDYMLLDEIPNKSKNIKIIEDVLKELGLYCSEEFANSCYGLNVDDKEECLKLINKRDLRRHAKALKKKGELTVKRLKGADALQVSEKMFGWHQEIWQSRGFTSMFEDKKHRNFFNSLLELPVGVMWVLYIDGNEIAIEQGFEMNETYIAYCQAFDLKYFTNSPGTLLLYRIMEHYINQGYKCIDLSRGAEKYKTRFTNIENINHQLLIHRSLIRYWMNLSYAKVKEAVMKRPKLHYFINKHKQWFSLKMQVLTGAQILKF